MASDPVTPEEYGLRAAKRQLKKDNASLVEQNLALRSKVSVLAAQLEEAQERERQLREALRDDPAKWSFAALVLIAGLILESEYPPDIFTGESGDPGPVFVSLLRNALAAYDAIALPSSQQQGHTEAS